MTTQYVDVTLRVAVEADTRAEAVALLRAERTSITRLESEDYVFDVSDLRVVA